MKDTTVELSPTTREVVVPSGRLEAKPTAATHVSRTPVLPANHSCEDPARLTSGRRRLARSFPSADRLVQAGQDKPSIASLFAVLQRTGNATRFEKATVAALVAGAAISILASAMYSAKLLTAWPALARLVERFLS